MMTSTETKQDFLPNTLKLIDHFLSDIIEDTQLIGEHSSNSELCWNQKVSQITTNISRFVEITTLLSKLVMKRCQNKMSEAREAHINLLFIIKAMNQAHQKQDYIALEELIKYELKDNLIQWKINLIPQIKILILN
jgi:hypothetical protein